MQNNTMTDMTNATPRELAEEMVRLLYKKGANDISLYFVGDETTLTDYHLIATGRSSTHVKSLGNDLDYELTQRGATLRAMEGKDGGAWILLDFYSVIVHIFDGASREFYNLERLQKPEAQVDISALLTPTDN